VRCLALFVALAVVTPALALDFRDDFSSRRPGWEPLSGDWQWQEGAFLRRRATDLWKLSPNLSSLGPWWRRHSCSRFWDREGCLPHRSAGS